MTTLFTSNSLNEIYRETSSEIDQLAQSILLSNLFSICHQSIVFVEIYSIKTYIMYFLPV